MIDRNMINSLFLFSAGSGAGSHHLVQVNVAGKGKATGTATFSYAWDVTTIEPESVSFGGKNLFIFVEYSNYPKISYTK